MLQRCGSTTNFMGKRRDLLSICRLNGTRGRVAMKCGLTVVPVLLAAFTAGCAAQPRAVPVPPPIRFAGAQSPIASMVIVPAGSELAYVSGTVPDPVNPNAPEGSVQRFGDTATQTRSVLDKIERELTQRGHSLRDVVMMRVFLVAPPGQQRMDFGGMMRAYRERFGTPANPNRPARSTMEVAGLVDPGWLVEIEVTSARPAGPQPEIIPVGSNR